MTSGLFSGLVVRIVSCVFFAMLGPVEGLLLRMHTKGNECFCIAGAIWVGRHFDKSKLDLFRLIVDRNYSLSCTVKFDGER